MPIGRGAFIEMRVKFLGKEGCAYLEGGGYWEKCGCLLEGECLLEGGCWLEEVLIERVVDAHRKGCIQGESFGMRVNKKGGCWM